MVAGLKQQNRRGGRFFGRRVNCEQVPLLPARVVARMLSDPRKISYLLVWRNRQDGTVQEAARIASHYEMQGMGGLDWNGSFEIERHDGTRNFIRTVLRPLPRNGGRVWLLICPYCGVPRFGLYGWEPGGRFTTSVARSSWGCRKCNRLRYESEGGALVHRGRGAIARLLELCGGALRSARTDPWHPHVFTSPEEAAEAGLVTLK
jgi:hypothetical protein